MPRPELALVVAGALVGALAVAFRALADRPVDLVLFSGQTELPDVVAEGSASVLLLLVVAKGLAYALSLGAGFRGGPVFPAIALGVAVGVMSADVLPGLEHDARGRDRHRRRDRCSHACPLYRCAARDVAPGIVSSGGGAYGGLRSGHRLARRDCLAEP